jgi:hypothetical protein
MSGLCLTAPFRSLRRTSKWRNSTWSVEKITFPFV